MRHEVYPSKAFVYTKCDYTEYFAARAGKIADALNHYEYVIATFKKFIASAGLNYFGAKSTRNFREVFDVEKKSQQNDEHGNKYLTSKNSPELKKAMDKISSELLKRNKNLYRRLANKN